MNRRPSKHRGSVLIVVLVVCLGLVSVTLLFGHSMAMAFRGADNDVAGRQAEQAIEGAARFAMTLMLNAETPHRLPEVSTYESEAVPVGEATFWFIGQPDLAQTNNSTVPVFGLVDEGSKLNLNTATLEMLMALPNMTEELASAIIDWRDVNDDVTGSTGAESSVYLQRQPAYACKNAPFESVEELALLNGADRELIFGEDANLNGLLDPNEDDGDKSLPPDNSDGRLDAGIASYVTVFSREPLLDAEGAARININVTPPPAELWTKMEEVLSAEVRQQVEARVGQGPFRSVLQFCWLSEMNAADFDKIAGFLTASTADVPANFVNVQTASETVLASIPSIGATKASALVAARASRTQDTSVDWIREPLGDDVAAAGDLTMWSYQVTADVAAVGRHGRGYRRARMVIDLTEATPRIVYRRNLSPLGWALGSEVRQMLAERKEVR